MLEGVSSKSGGGHSTNTNSNVLYILQRPWLCTIFTSRCRKISGDNIQMWHLGECNINFHCTLKNDIARGACAKCNIIFQTAIKIDIARNQMPYLFHYMPTAHSN